MIVFKNYFKILKKYKFVILLYVGILLVFTIIGTTNKSTASNFKAVKPNVAVINLDESSKVVDNFTKYLDKYTNVIDIENDESKINDALFYKDVNAVIYIYKGYSNDFLNNKDQLLEVKYTEDYSASYANMILNRYLKIADLANDNISNEDELLNLINNTLKEEANVLVDSKIDTDSLSNASYFFNFSNYSILAICIYTTSIVIFRFNDDKIRKRNIVSKTSLKKINKELYLGSLVFTFIVWLFLIILSLLIVGKQMLTLNGLFLIINSLVFLICALSIGFIVGNVLKGEEAISGVVTVIALGTSFLCGSFIPLDYLPSGILNISKFLPSYWYISNNELIKTIEIFNLESISNILTNMGIVLLFTVLFIIINNYIVKKKSVY